MPKNAIYKNIKMYLNFLQIVVKGRSNFRVWKYGIQFLQNWNTYLSQNSKQTTKNNQYIQSMNKAKNWWRRDSVGRAPG